MARKTTKRKSKGKKSYAIIVDGNTEVWYFTMMKRQEYFAKNIAIKPELPKKKKLADQFEFVKKEARDYDKVFWLLDLDVIIKETAEQLAGKKTALEEIASYIKTLNKYKNVEILFNTPCLEFWYLLHFKNTSTYYPLCSAAQKELKKFLPTYEKTEKFYTKKNNDIYKQLKPYQDEAMKKAEELAPFDIKNPKTAQAEIYKIIAFFKQESSL